MKKNSIKKTKNSVKLASFIKFCILHPEFRFWQSLNVWSQSAFILRAKKCTEDGEFIGIKDTYYEK